jgi:uncharacterized protein (DUF305 family)
METKNNVSVLSVLALVLGLGIGYFAGTNTAVSKMPNQAMTPSGGMHDAMSGMMVGLDGKTGEELDKAFIDGMIVHHEGAVAMARALLAGTKRPELITLGKNIIAAQTGEIEMMKGWRADWFAQ